MAANEALDKAKKNKRDEFCTRLVDIGKEPRHCHGHFRGKSVLLDRDDPRESGFFKYFAMNFNFLGLRKLTATRREGAPMSWGRTLPRFSGMKRADDDAGKPCKIGINEVHDANGDGAIDLADAECLLRNDAKAVSPLKGDGDFRSEERVGTLKGADVVATNPPFSPFCEFIGQLVHFDKKFIIIGNINAVSYRDAFELFRKGGVWLGVSIHGGDREFRVPDGYPLDAAGSRVDENGAKRIRVKGVRRFTNIGAPQRHEPLILHQRYDPAPRPREPRRDRGGEGRRHPQRLSGRDGGPRHVPGQIPSGSIRDHRPAPPSRLSHGGFRQEGDVRWRGDPLLPEGGRDVQMPFPPHGDKKQESGTGGRDMGIELLETTVGEVADGLVDDDEEGALGRGGHLDIRPRRRRGFVRKDDKRDAVIRTVIGGYPLSVTYRAERGGGGREIMDGRRLTGGFRRHVHGRFSIGLDGYPQFFSNLARTEPQRQSSL